jgi:uncharacterized protein DUF1329
MNRRRVFGLSFAAMVAAAAVVVAALQPAYAQVKPGDVIGPDNASKVRDLVSPGVYWRVEHGMSLKVVPTERIDWPPPYKEATEKYSAQVRLSADHRSLVGYVAGQPFPLIDPNDPEAGSKVMWNYFFRPISTDDYDLRFFDCESVYAGRNKPYKVIWYYQAGHYAGYNEVGRTEVEPLPIDPDFKSSGRYAMSALYPTLAPQDARGFGTLRFRYAAGDRGDDDWIWLPGARRLRRVSESLHSTSIGPQAYNGDDFECFAGKTENYNWRFLGEKNMLACINDPRDPPPTCPTDGGASHCPTNWEMRHLYLVEGKARPERLPGDLFSKHVIYIDSEADFGMYQDQYDHRGELFVNYTSWMKYADRPVPDAKIAIYPFKREFQTGSSSVNVQGGLSSVCYHPGYDVPEKECWYINMGAVDRQFFDVNSMVKAAP